MQYVQDTDFTEEIYKLILNQLTNMRNNVDCVLMSMYAFIYHTPACILHVAKVLEVEVEVEGMIHTCVFSWGEKIDHTCDVLLRVALHRNDQRVIKTRADTCNRNDLMC